MMARLKYPRGLYLFLYFAQILLVQQSHAIARPSCFKLHVRKRFLPILGRSVRADLIGRQFWPNPVDFGKNRRFPGFGLVDGRDIAHAARGFLPIIGRRAVRAGTAVGRHWIS